MKIKVINLVSYVTVIIALCFSFYVFYAVTYPFKPIEFHDDNFQVMKKTLKGNDIIPVRFRFTRHSCLTTTVTRRLVDTKYVIMFSDIEVSRPPGEYDFVSYSLNVPNFIPPGEYYIEYGFIFQINPLRKIVINKRTELFRVIK